MKGYKKKIYLNSTFQVDGFVCIKYKRYVSLCVRMNVLTKIIRPAFSISFCRSRFLFYISFFFLSSFCSHFAFDILLLLNACEMGVESTTVLICVFYFPFFSFPLLSPFSSVSLYTFPSISVFCLYPQSAQYLVSFSLRFDVDFRMHMWQIYYARFKIERMFNVHMFHVLISIFHFPFPSHTYTLCLLCAPVLRIFEMEITSMRFFMLKSLVLTGCMAKLNCNGKAQTHTHTSERIKPAKPTSNLNANNKIINM